MAAKTQSKAKAKATDVVDVENDEPLAPPTLFRGHKFYLARTLKAEDRAYARRLITLHGGTVVEHMSGGAVEIVPRSHLKPGTDWVSSEFIEDCVKHGVIQTVTHYMAPTKEEVVERRSSRKKIPYTAEDDVKMFLFLKNDFPKYYGAPTVPESIWKVAEKRQVTSHSSQSMHQHFRKKLFKLTAKERENLFRNVEKEQRGDNTEGKRTEQHTEEEKEAARDNQDDGDQARDKRGEPEQADDQQAGPEQARRKTEQEPVREQAGRRRVSAKAKAKAKNAAQDQEEEKEDEVTQSDEEIKGRARKRVKKSEEQAAEVSTPVIEETTGSTTTPVKPLAEKKIPEPVVAVAAAAVPVMARSPRNESLGGRSGEVFRGYWEGAVSDPSLLSELQRFFVPPPSPKRASPPSPKRARSPSPVRDDREAPAKPRPQSRPQKRLRGRMARRTRPQPRTPSPPRAEENEEEEVEAEVQDAPDADQRVETPAPRRRRDQSDIETPVRTPSREPRRERQSGRVSDVRDLVSPHTPTPRKRTVDSEHIVSAAAADAEDMICRLQFKTAHDMNAVCSALYWASGDANVALAFLLGHHPKEMWSPHDDQQLVDFMQPETTEAMIIQAKQQRLFRNMHVERSVDDIMRRIRFLL
ncbi:hypothetical protein Poli38472_010252 [Pythium oligandrum]|uniref:BRCT domain-containing protein n=1 Tax=Pythium oligandrum TaxID=41045 RepID=A0A8K1FHE1_PYTOL|nr:hypothetical protein Poli38472_010252 [Pythium oligandrum]|eukprot:TMW58693.1 hypothetical protein Poli38472_010252 [Pythium oligandrum]